MTIRSCGIYYGGRDVRRDVRGIHDFAEVWGLDFEFWQPDGDRVLEVRCMVAKELRTGREIRLWADELRWLAEPPFRTDPEVVVAAYGAHAEMLCFLALGWEMPANLLDLYSEYRLMMSGLTAPHGYGYLGALTHFGIRGGVSVLVKDEMRDLAIRGGPYTWQEREDLLDYCATDADLGSLLAAMLPAIESPPALPPCERCKGLGHALHRGDYIKAAAEMEHRGIPIDVDSRDRILAEWPRVEPQLIRQCDTVGVYEDGVFVANRFDDYLSRNHIPWPRSSTGLPKLDRDTFSDAVLTYPELKNLHELRETLSKMREWNLPVGRDGRSRVWLAPFGAKTGRNAPPGGYVFNFASHLRFLIKPQPGYAIAYLDFEQQEFGIAAYLSGDERMMDAYRTGDAYWGFAVQAGAVPAGTVYSPEYKSIRDLYKTCALGVQYGMGVGTLSGRLNGSNSEAADLLRKHRETYPRYWRWSDGAVAYATAIGSLYSTYGWRVHVSADTRPTSLRNFLLQANGAEMLRMACVLCSERGLPVIAPVHDALLIEDTASRIRATASAVAETMVEASELVLPGFPLRVETKVFNDGERFQDARGTKMWTKLWDIIDAPTKDRRRICPLFG